MTDEKRSGAPVVDLVALRELLAAPLTDDLRSMILAEQTAYEEYATRLSAWSCDLCADGIAFCKAEDLKPGHRLICRDCGNTFTWRREDYADRVATVRGVFALLARHARRPPA